MTLLILLTGAGEQEAVVSSIVWVSAGRAFETVTKKREFVTVTPKRSFVTVTKDRAT